MKRANLKRVVLALGSIANCDAYAAALWRIEQNDNYPLAGVVVTNPDASARILRVRDYGGSDFALTETGATSLLTGSVNILGTSGEWVWAKNVSAANPEQMYTKSLRTVWQPVPDCPTLIAGGSFQAGNARCAGGGLQILSGTTVTAWLAVPEGYVLRHVINPTRLLLQSTHDQRFAVANVEVSATITLDTTVSLPAISAPIQKLIFHRPGGFALGNAEVFGFLTNNGYLAISSLGSQQNFPSTGVPEDGGQCYRKNIFGGSSGLITVESDSGLRMLRYFSESDGALLSSAELEPNDVFWCWRTGDVAFTMNARVIRRVADGDELRAVPDSLVYKASDPQMGPGRLYLSGNQLYVLFGDGIVRRYQPGVPLQIVNAPGWLTGHTLSIGPLANALLKESFLSFDGASETLNITQRTRQPSSGSPTGQQQWSLPIQVGVANAIRQLRVLQSTDMNDADVFVLGVQNRSVLLTPNATPKELRAFTKPGGEIARVTRSIGVGNQIFTEEPQSNGEAILSRWSFAGDLQASSILTGSNYTNVPTPVLPGVLLYPTFGAAGILAGISAHDASGVVWQRSFASTAGCQLMPFQGFPLVACNELSKPQSSHLERLDAATGNTLWSRIITPLDPTQVWRANRAWLEGGVLYVLGRENPRINVFGTAREIRLSAARLDPVTGSLQTVGPTRVIPMTDRTPLSANVSIDGLYQYPFNRYWLQGLSGNGYQRERMQFRVNADNSIQVNPSGYSITDPARYITETLPSIVSNDSVRWFTSTGYQTKFETVARGPGATPLQSPLRVEIRERWLPNFSPNARPVDVVIANPNPSVATEVRLLVSNLSCFEGDLFDVAAQSERKITCNAFTDPLTQAPLIVSAQLRQPINFDGFYEYDPEFDLARPARAELTLTNFAFANGFDE